MPDLIAHIPDWDAFEAEMLDKGLAIQHDGLPIHFQIDCFPFIRKGNEALTNLLNPPAAFAQLASVDILGNYTAVLAAPPKRAIYDRIYPRPIVTWVDEDGIEHTHQDPEWFGVFAE